MNKHQGNRNKSEKTTKVDPSFKSKRYRDKLRTEIKCLETLIPIDRSLLHRKLDSQTVFRLTISYFRFHEISKSLGFFSPQAASEPDGFLKDIQDTVLTQLFDGFIWLATTDGTILFSTDNVLNYIGFNQIDLMHRCVYGMVHPDDHQQLKDFLEPYEKDVLGRPGLRPLAFVCRMRCFSGTTAGYLKIHCSGKVLQIPEVQSAARGYLSKEVVILYCRPFMLSGVENGNDVQQNVFWTKHDMDLKIKEIDPGAMQHVGYVNSSVSQKSFYEFVHPADVATVSACHCQLMQSTDIQTMYFRFISSSGALVWLQSRGKVVCKNSKKFSFVFTHSPVREEDSMFLQYESVHRQQHILGSISQGQFLPSLHSGSEHTHVSHSTSEDMALINRQKHCASQIGFVEDLSLTLYTPMVSCPSNLHSMSGRHSPILPSTHVAHKITQREKNLQFQLYKKKQQHSFLRNKQTERDHQDKKSTIQKQLSGLESKSKQIKSEPGLVNIKYDHLQYPNNSISRFVAPNSLCIDNRCNCSHSHKTINGTFNNLKLQYDSNQLVTENTLGRNRQELYFASPNMRNRYYSMPNPAHTLPSFGYLPQNLMSMNQHAVSYPEQGLQMEHDLHFQNQAPIHFSRNENDYNDYRVYQPPSILVSGGQPQKRNSLSYDIEASIHMKIVDSSMTGFNRSNLNLPNIGSFLGNPDCK